MRVEKGLVARELIMRDESAVARLGTALDDVYRIFKKAIVEAGNHITARASEIRTIHTLGKISFDRRGAKHLFLEHARLLPARPSLLDHAGDCEWRSSGQILPSWGCD